jgi:DNA-binding transcriptional LysR family regulator
VHAPAPPAEFTRAYPEIEVEIWIEDGLVDIVAAGFDAGIRNAHLLQPDMISVRIDDGVDFAYVASPAYLAEAGTPRVPSDLLEHRCINYRLTSSKALRRWRFERAGESVLVDVPSQLVFNDFEAILRAALAGCGVARAIKEQAPPSSRLGRPRGGAARLDAAGTPNFLYYAGRRNVPPALRAFIDAMRAGARPLYGHTHELRLSLGPVPAPRLRAPRSCPQSSGSPGRQFVAHAGQGHESRAGDAAASASPFGRGRIGSSPP